MAKRTKIIVVDACVARAASANPNEPAKACKDTLDYLYQEGWPLAMTPAIQKEWKKHSSAYSRKWLAQMYGRRLVSKVSAVPCASVQSLIEGGRLSRARRTAAAKDMLLIEGALASDKRIVSQDANARGIFSSLVDDSPELRSLGWLTVDGNSATTWFKQGAPLASARL